MWDWELIKSGSSQGRYEVLVQYTHEDFHYAHAISYDTEQNEYCLHNHALYELVYCVRGDVIYQAEGVRYQMEPHSLLLFCISCSSARSSPLSDTRCTSTILTRIPKCPR